METALRQLAHSDPQPANEPLAPMPESLNLREAIDASWSVIAPFWPLANLVAVNPLHGLEDRPIEKAVFDAAVLFEQRELPPSLDAVNRETIKWCQAFFDEGQATLAMPLRQRGLFRSWRTLARYDRRLAGPGRDRRGWLEKLPEAPEAAIAACLDELGIETGRRTLFLTLMLTTLPGWAAHVRYRTGWGDGAEQARRPVSNEDYLALRLALACLLWPGAASLLGWHQAVRTRALHGPGPLLELRAREATYRRPLLRELLRQAAETRTAPGCPEAQLVFCIDVRSEPFRRALEAAGDYETLGFAGFFGLPVRIEDTCTGASQRSCPVLLEPRHVIRTGAGCKAPTGSRAGGGGKGRRLFKRLYQSLKYSFTAPFALVEALGPASGAWMALRSLAPVLAERLRERAAGWFDAPSTAELDLGDLPPEARCEYAESALRTMGLTRNFARLVVLCGHGSTTRNNAFASALDCGACGGRHGAGNARALADILNDPWVREHLIGRGIRIPGTTRFVGALHDTTTDELSLFAEPPADQVMRQLLDRLRRDLEAVRERNARRRLQQLGARAANGRATARTLHFSRDWAQVRPEWGLARNAAFIAAPRTLTRQLDLHGRAFLHSYDWRQDPDGKALALILTAPMVVAQWINAQYLFSTLDNVAYGAGSKVTKNVTGKIGMMQGNASDLMHGLPLQSVFYTDAQPWHQPQRLLAVVLAPRERLRRVIGAQPVLQKLFGNGWVTLACIDPNDGGAHLLERDLVSWQQAGHPHRTTHRRPLE
jgi:uncharacterized protein YbcC (UPF0753/DUF2309 family)